MELFNVVSFGRCCFTATANVLESFPHANGQANRYDASYQEGKVLDIVVAIGVRSKVNHIDENGQQNHNQDNGHDECMADAHPVPGTPAYECMVEQLLVLHLLLLEGNHVRVAGRTCRCQSGRPLAVLWTGQVSTVELGQGGLAVRWRGERDHAGAATLVNVGPVECVETIGCTIAVARLILRGDRSEHGHGGGLCGPGHQLIMTRMEVLC